MECRSAVRKISQFVLRKSRVQISYQSYNILIEVFYRFLFCRRQIPRECVKVGLVRVLPNSPDLFFINSTTITLYNCTIQLLNMSLNK